MIDLMKHNYYSIYPGELEYAKAILERYESILKQINEVHKKLPGHINVHLHNEVCYHAKQVRLYTKSTIDWFKDFIECCESNV